MKHEIIGVLSSLVLFIISFPSASGEIIELDNSVSPNGRFYLSIQTSSNEYQEPVAKLQVRRATDGKVAREFNWEQFSPTITSSSAKSIWNSNSTAFALTWYQARGYTGAELYEGGAGTWTELKFPDYPKRVIGKNHIVSRGKGRFIPDRWVSDNVIRMISEEEPEWDGQGQKPNFGDVEEDDWVYFQITREHGATILRFLRLEARHDHNYDI